MTSTDTFLIGLILGLLLGWLMNRRQRFYNNYLSRRGAGKL